LEQQNLYDKAGDGDRNLLSTPQMDGALFVQRTALDMFTCPSRRRTKLFRHAGGSFAENASNNTFGDIARSDYAINCGDQEDNLFLPNPPSYSAALYEDDDRNYAWDSDKPMLLTGIAYERSQIGTSHIIDGLSNAYFVGEKYIDADHYETGGDLSDDESWCTGYSEDNYRSAWLRPMQDRSGPIQDSSGGEHLPGFGSTHSAGFNMALCDGSVHSLSYSIDLNVHKNLANRRNGDKEDIDIDKL